MAHIAENSGTVGANLPFFGLVKRISDAVARRRVYNRTYAELNNLTTRELDDLGISRSMISRLAYEAAFEN
ncbi:MAG: DUF1127 domain-containing protein [Alphaproteobacteria bacterium]|jgi:uncharacterized protein YjiS (DUF1127 family)|nr:DUF1127 domain-containing protein [Alphaproteobacteria bacterium]